MKKLTAGVVLALLSGAVNAGTIIERTFVGDRYTFYPDRYPNEYWDKQQWTTSFTFEKGSNVIRSLHGKSGDGSSWFKLVPGATIEMRYEEVCCEGPWKYYYGTSNPVLVQDNKGDRFNFSFSEVFVEPPEYQPPSLESFMMNVYAVFYDAPGYSQIADIGAENYFFERAQFVSMRETHVPEPVSAGIMLLGVAGVGLASRRRKSITTSAPQQ